MPKSLALTSISLFAVLNVLADLISFTPFLGVPGASFRLGWISSTLTGFLLGTKLGGISCLIGGFVEIFIGQPPIFGFFTPLRPAISAFITGMLVSRKWHIPAIALFTLVLIWLLLPVGKDASVILIFHIVGLGIILFFRGKIGDFIESKVTRRVALGLILAVYCGNISRHLFGSILSATILNLPSIFFVSALPFTLIEQLTFAIGTTIIGLYLNRLKLRELLQSG
jgi:hypothetical protein